jgi:hypothetical protein
VPSPKGPKESLSIQQDAANAAAAKRRFDAHAARRVPANEARRTLLRPALVRSRFAL